MNFFRNIGIKLIFSIFVSIIIILFITLATISWNKLNSSFEGASVMGEKCLPNVEKILDIKSEFKNIRLINTKLSYASTDADRKKIKDELKIATDKTLDITKELKNNALNSNVENLVDGISRDIQEYYSLTLQKDNFENDPEGLKNFVKTKTTPKGKAVDEAIVKVIENIEGVASSISKELEHVTDPTVVIITTIFSITVSLILMYILYFLIASITKEIKYITSLSQQVANGHLNLRKDREIEDNMSADVKVLYHGFEAMTNNLKEIVTNLIENSDTLTTKSGELTDFKENMVAELDNILSQSISISAAFDEMVATSKSIAENCSAVAVSSNSALETTQGGMDVVTNTVKTIKSYVEKTKGDCEAVIELSDKIKQIDTIIETIKSIADQTNLLALNAAIEAARAGEYGRGFAVVADEVRSLAVKTGESTKQINKMVHDLVTLSASANSSISETVGQLDSLGAETEELENSLSKIITEVTEVTEQISLIATATEEQTATINEMSSNVNNVKNSTEVMSDNSHILVENSQNISDVSSDIQVHTSRFSV